MMGTEEVEYTNRLLSQAKWWKRLLDVQRPYRRHLQRLQLGLVLDVGCGTGRNLAHIAETGQGVGIDHNPHSVAIAKSRRLIAFTPGDFLASSYATEPCFDSLLLSHVAEHLQFADAVGLLKTYLRHLKRGGRVVLITPQEAGYDSDPTHVTFVDRETGERILRDSGVKVATHYSFPLPRFFGRLFTYNEFVTIGRKTPESDRGNDPSGDGG
jgi:SAM-dependent methyltransferase